MKENSRRKDGNQGVSGQTNMDKSGQVCSEGFGLMKKHGIRNVHSMMKLILIVSKENMKF